MPNTAHRATVEVWLVHTAEVDLQAATSILDESELQRVARFAGRSGRGRSARDEFIVGRVFTRLVLGVALDRDPSSLRFVVDDNGKPAVAGTEARFNLSHSSGVIALAVAAATEGVGTPGVGIDIETVRPVDQRAAIMAKRYSPLEQALVGASTDASADRQFLQVWTRKEAVIKAAGATLASLSGTDTARPTHGRNWSAAIEHLDEPFTGTDLDLALADEPDVVGSVAASAGDLQVRVRPRGDALELFPA